MPVVQTLEPAFGIRFYEHHGVGNVIACGAPVAERLLGGSWTSRGRAPRGFPDLETALNVACSVWGVREAKLVW